MGLEDQACALGFEAPDFYGYPPYFTYVHPTESSCEFMRARAPCGVSSRTSAPMSGGE